MVLTAIVAVAGLAGVGLALRDDARDRPRRYSYIIDTRVLPAPRAHLWAVWDLRTGRRVAHGACRWYFTAALIGRWRCGQFENRDRECPYAERAPRRGVHR